MKLTASIEYAVYVHTDSKHVDERVRHDQVAENCVARCCTVFPAAIVTPTEIDADGVAVGETQVGDQLADGLRRRSVLAPIFVVQVPIASHFANHFDEWQPVISKSNALRDISSP